MNEFAQMLGDKEPFMLEGKPIPSLAKMADALASIDKKLFEQHCNKDKNDFYAWVLHSVGDQRLARDIKNIRHLSNMADIFRDRVAQLKDYARHPENAATVKRIDMYVDHVEFRTDDEICSNCEICHLICPMDAVEIKDNKKVINNDCTKCGFCVHFCPLEAISLTYNKEKHDFYTEHKMIPKLPMAREINRTKARQLFRGSYEIKGKCPPGCELCVQACPVNVIKRVDDKELSLIKVDTRNCLLCGACKVACPYGIIESHRVHIKHEGPEYCNAWNRAIEMLCRKEVKSAYHNNNNLGKIRNLIEKTGMRKY